MTAREENVGQPLHPRIKRGRFDSLSLYEVTEHELEFLERGSPNSTYLNFAVFFLSVGLSFLASLLTTTIDSVRVFTVFVVLTVLGFAIGTLLLVVWIRTRASISNLIRKIKGRMPTDGAEDNGGAR